jgi:hypothetical protein
LKIYKKKDEKNMEKQFKFILDEKEANLIMQALGEMPARMSMTLITKLQQQAIQAASNVVPIKKEVTIEECIEEQIDDIASKISE